MIKGAQADNPLKAAARATLLSTKRVLEVREKVEGREVHEVREVKVMERVRLGIKSWRAVTGLGTVLLRFRA